MRTVVRACLQSARGYPDFVTGYDSNRHTASQLAHIGEATSLNFLSWLKYRIFGKRVAPGMPPLAPGTGPARLLIMRHAEKTGDKRDKNLSDAGWARAEELATYIPQALGKPDFLIAASNSVKSKRPKQTLEPLGAALGLDIWAELDDEEVDELVDELSRTPEWAGKFGVISWRHSDLPRLIGALGAPAGTYPDPWDSAVYDLMIEITYDAPGKTPRVRKITPPF